MKPLCGSLALPSRTISIRRLLCRDVVAQGNPGVYKALRNELAAVLEELYQTFYKRRPPVMAGLLNGGVYILAGAQKIGKYFLVAQIAYHVSTGKNLWGYTVPQGSVLYLALEDDFPRIQGRMFCMFGVNDTPYLHFATAAGKSAAVWKSSSEILYGSTRIPGWW